MYQLTKQEYDNIFSFYSAINSDYTNYENIVLFSLSTIFNIRLTVYGAFYIGAGGAIKLSRLISNSIRGEFLDLYKKEIYLEDPFLNNYAQICYTNPDATYFTDDQLSEESYRNSGYSKLLRKSRIGHEAMIGVNGLPGSLVHVIRVYKTIDAGDFTEQERALFHYIGQAFNHSKMLYSKFVRQQRKLEAVSAYCDETAHGFAILDGKGRLLQCNAAFMNFSAKLSSGLTKWEIANDIIFAVTGKDKLPEDTYFREEAHVNGVLITIQKKRVVLSIRTENLFFITLQKDRGVRVPDLDSVSLSARYGLTRRETELALLVAKGYSNQEISDELFIGASTVKTHISNIYGKLGVGSRKEMLKRLRADEPRRPPAE